MKRYVLAGIVISGMMLAAVGCGNKTAATQGSNGASPKSNTSGNTIGKTDASDEDTVIVYLDDGSYMKVSHSEVGDEFYIGDYLYVYKDGTYVKSDAFVLNESPYCYLCDQISRANVIGEKQYTLGELVDLNAYRKELPTLESSGNWDEDLTDILPFSVKAVRDGQLVNPSANDANTNPNYVNSHEIIGSDRTIMIIQREGNSLYDLIMRCNTDDYVDAETGITMSDNRSDYNDLENGIVVATDLPEDVILEIIDESNQLKWDMLHTSKYYTFGYDYDDYVNNGIITETNYNTYNYDVDAN